jgi:hypothetical protein|tara:strand:+ start:784 stop:936 length:153 start_codon:yes stop_codon:yes gene_type:complete
MTTQKDTSSEPVITRVEVIGKEGRLLVKYVESATISMQDEGRTLKVFLKE